MIFALLGVFSLAQAQVLPDVQYLTAQQIRDNAANVRIAILGVTSTGDHYINGVAGTGHVATSGTLASVQDPTANDVLRLEATSGGYYLKRESDNQYLNCSGGGQDFTLSATASTVWTVEGMNDANWGTVTGWDDLFSDIAKQLNGYMVRFRSAGQYMNGQGATAKGGLRGGTGAWSFQYVRNCDYGAGQTNYTVTYKYKYNGVQFDSEEKQVAEGGAYPAPKTFDFAEALTTPSGTVVADAEVVFNVNFTSFPFVLSTDFANATWYTIKMRDSRYVYYAPGNTTNEAQSATTQSYDDAYQWAFIGNPTSFKIVNKAAGASMAMKYVSDLKNQFVTSESSDYVAVSNATVHDGDRNVYIKVKGSANLFINSRDNTMAYWNSPNASGEIGSALGLALVPQSGSDLVDGEPYVNSSSREVEELTYTRTFNNTTYQALYVPFAMDYADWSADFDVYRINNVRSFDDDNDGVFDRVELRVFILPEGSSTEANRPYVIKAKSTGEHVFTKTNTTLEQTVANSITAASQHFLYTFTGTYTPMTNMYANDYYALGNGTLVKANDASTTLKPFRWYLAITSRSSALISNAPRLDIVEEQTEGISALENGQKNEKIYDLQGRVLKNGLNKGVVIVNGKKILK